MGSCSKSENVRREMLSPPRTIAKANVAMMRAAAAVATRAARARRFCRVRTTRTPRSSGQHDQRDAHLAERTIAAMPAHAATSARARFHHAIALIANTRPRSAAYIRPSDGAGIVEQTGGADNQPVRAHVGAAPSARLDSVTIRDSSCGIQRAGS